MSSVLVVPPGRERLVGFGLSAVWCALVTLVWVLLMAMLLLLLGLALTFAVVPLVGIDRVRRKPVVVVHHSRSRQPPQQEGAGDQKDAKVPEAVEDGCHQVTLPTNARIAHAGRENSK